jgi:lipopolysaccharide transport system ATP-binding protein
MGDAVISARGVGKEYRVARVQDRYPTLREALVRLVVDRGGSADAPFMALRDVSFDVGAGEIVGVIGGNGAGKSTLLKIFSRVTFPTTGRVELRGRVGSLLEVGTGFHPELTGRENIFLNGAILGMRRAETARNFDAIVAFAEVERFVDTPVKRYSSGMYLRLAFAVAAHLEPEILLVDEVLAVGDAAFQKKCLAKMGEVARSGRTVLFVSHNMTAVQGLCTRAIWLRQGELAADGPPGAIVSAYLQASVAAVDERVWPVLDEAPGNDAVRLRRAGVRPDDGSDGAVITTRTPLRLEIEYINRQPGAHLNLSLYVFNEQGVMAFNALPVTETTWQGKPLPAGTFRDTCFIPGDLLNDGVHWVELLVVQDDARVIYRHPDLLTFEVRDVADDRGAWFGDWAGVVRPRLRWTTELLERADGAGAAVRDTTE